MRSSFDSAGIGLPSAMGGPYLLRVDSGHIISVSELIKESKPGRFQAQGCDRLSKCHAWHLLASLKLSQRKRSGDLTTHRVLLSKTGDGKHIYKTNPLVFIQQIDD